MHHWKTCQKRPRCMMEPYVVTTGPTNDVTKDFLPVKKRSHVHTYFRVEVFLTACKSTLFCHNKAQQMMSHEAYFQSTVFPPPLSLLLSLFLSSFYFVTTGPTNDVTRDFFKLTALLSPSVYFSLSFSLPSNLSQEAQKLTSRET